MDNQENGDQEDRDREERLRRLREENARLRQEAKESEEQMQAAKRVITTVSGKNIGYGSTSECLVQCGLVILQEQDRLPNAGGVYSPGRTEWRHLKSAN